MRRVIHRKEAKLQMAEGKWQKAKMKTTLASSRCRLDDSSLELPPFESLVAVLENRGKNDSNGELRWRKAKSEEKRGDFLPPLCH